MACPNQDNSSTLYVVGAIADILSDDEVEHNGTPGAHHGPWRDGNHSEVALNRPAFFVSGWCQAW